MQFITAVLFVLMCPLAILAYKGHIAKNVNCKVRKAATVVQAAVVMAVVTVWFYTQQAIIVENDTLLGGVNSANGMSMGCLTATVTFLLGIYWVCVVAAEFVFRKSEIKPLSYVLLSVCPAVPLAGYAVYIYFAQPFYFPLVAIGCVLTSAVILMHVCNFTLSLSRRWQCVVCVILNCAVFLASAFVLYAVLSAGIAAGIELDAVSIVLIAVASIAFIAPSFVCAGGIVLKLLAKSGLGQ